jgi:hypothetical protein
MERALHLGFNGEPFDITFFGTKVTLKKHIEGSNFQSYMEIPLRLLFVAQNYFSQQKRSTLEV